MIKFHFEAEKRQGDKFNDVKLLQSYGRNDNQLVNRHTDCYMGFSQYVVNNYGKVWQKLRPNDYFLNVIDTYNVISERFRNLQNVISLLERGILHLEKSKMDIENVLNLHEMSSSVLDIVLKKLNQFSQVLIKENQSLTLFSKKAAGVTEDDCAFTCSSNEELMEIIKIHALSAMDGGQRAKGKLIGSSLLHADETGINVNGKRLWLHTACNDLWTYFFPHEKRGSEAIALLHQ